MNTLSPPRVVLPVTKAANIFSEYWQYWLTELRTAIIRLQELVDKLLSDASNTGQYVVPAGIIDGSNAVFTLPSAAAPGSVVVFLNGLALAPGLYTVAGTTLTLNDAPLDADILSVAYHQESQFLQFNYVVPMGAIDGSNLVFSLPNTPAANSVVVFQNGLAKRPVIDFSVSNANITMTEAPLELDILTVSYDIAA